MATVGISAHRPRVVGLATHRWSADLVQVVAELSDPSAGDGPREGSPGAASSQSARPADVNLVKAEMSALGQEHLRVLLLNTKNHVVGSHDVYRGSLNTAVVRVGELFREAIRQNCAAMVLVHNHPSGDPTPSP